MRTQPGVGFGESGRIRFAAEPYAVVELQKAGPPLFDQDVGAGVPGEFGGHQRPIRIHQREVMGEAEHPAEFTQGRGTATACIHGQAQQPDRERFEIPVGLFPDDHRPEWFPRRPRLRSYSGFW